MPSYCPVPSTRQLVRVGLDRVPALIAREGYRPAWRFVEFFSASIRNPNTRRAYGRAVGDFFRWCTQHRVRDLAHISSTIVAAHVEQLQHTHAKPSVKQHLAAVRMLFDWLVTGCATARIFEGAFGGSFHLAPRGQSTPQGATQALKFLNHFKRRFGFKSPSSHFFFLDFDIL